MAASEVAQLMKQIEAEYQAAANGLSRLAVTSQHAFMERFFGTLKRECPMHF